MDNNVIIMMIDIFLVFYEGYKEFYKEYFYVDYFI